MRNNLWKKLLLLICLILLGHFGLIVGYALDSNTPIGLRFTHNYTTEDYQDASPYNWAMVQDWRGILYVANSKCVLEYDGEQWQQIPVANNSAARSLAIDNTGCIFVGAENELGYLSKDSKGQTIYRSLVTYLPLEFRQFGAVWQTYATKAGIFFRTQQALFRWDNQTMHIIKSDSPDNIFSTCYYLNERLYIRQKNVGLGEIVNDHFRLVPGGEAFAQLHIYAMFPKGKEEIIIATSEQGLVKYHNGSLSPFGQPANPWLIDKQIYHGCQLPDGRYALGTLRGGVAIVNDQGQITEIINKATGLQDDTISYLYPDNQGHLWLALYNGISKVDIASPISLYNERLGLAGEVKAITRYQGQLYVATSQGIYYLAADTSLTPDIVDQSSLRKFQLIPHTNNQNWTFLSLPDHLLAGTKEGVCQINNNTITKVQTQGPAFTLYASHYYPNRIYVGLDDGLASLKIVGSQFIDEGKVADVHCRVRSIVETANGDLWLGTSVDGVCQLTFDSEATNANSNSTRPLAKVTAYGTKEGLPDMVNNAVAQVKQITDEPLFLTRRGVYRFDPQHQHFSPDTSPLGANVGDQSISEIITDSENKIWFITATAKALIPQGEGRYQIETYPLSTLKQVVTLYPEPNGTVWLGNSQGLFCQQGTAKKNLNTFATLIRKVTAGKELYPLTTDLLDTSLKEIPTIKYNNNRIRFDCAVASFTEESHNQYQYFLEGVDKDWSDWTTQSYRDYLLNEGVYTFQARAKNVYGEQSLPVSYSFRVLPPWYRTWGAYLSYLVAIVGIGYGVVQLRLQNLHRQNQLLEQHIAERTAELAQAIAEIREAKEIVEQKNIETEKQNRALTEAKEAVEKKNHELIDSQQQANRIFSALAEALPGTVLDGKYRLDKKIGAGGFAAVFQGTHLILDRSIAVKVFRPQAGNDSPEAIERFRLEGISTCRINHPNAITVLDSGISSEGIAYLVMELLEGQTLAAEISETRVLSLKRCAEILPPICAVLAEAHANNIIHRDIKPDNIFLHQTKEGEVVKVLDFGIAKLQGTDINLPVNNSLATEQGITVGTPKYIAPERLFHKPYDGQADIYSLGVMLYEMLCGQAPFISMGNGMLDIILQHINDDPTPLRNLQPNIPAEIEAIVLTTLSKDPKARPTALALAEQFTAAVDRLPEELKNYINAQVVVGTARYGNEESTLKTVTPVPTVGVKAKGVITLKS